MKIIRVSKYKWLNSLLKLFSKNKVHFLDENEALDFVYGKFEEEYLKTSEDLYSKDLSKTSKNYMTDEELKMYDFCYNTKKLAIKKKIQDKLDKIKHILNMLNKLIQEEVRDEEELTKLQEFIQLCFTDRIKGGLNIEFVSLGENKYLNFGEILIKRINKISSLFAPAFIICFTYRYV